MNGNGQVFALFKPAGPTSHDMVDAVRRITGLRKVGHAGTLDPMASGVLVIGIGSGTKKLTQLIAKDKEYMVTIRLGATSTTDDAEGVIKLVAVQHIPTMTEVIEVVESMVGTLTQVPPVFSAVKVQGMPAHRRVRRGEEIELKARRVSIEAIEIKAYDWPKLALMVKTGPGVYIRALARDIGAKLECGGYVKELVRTRVGRFHLAEAMTEEQLTQTYGQNPAKPD